MIKESITQLFDNYDANKITDIPRCEFKPNRDPFHYIIPELILYKDLRTTLKPRSTEIKIQQEKFIDKIKRYANEFEFRKSYQSRALRHTLEYTAFYGLIVFGFYSRQFSGWKRCAHIFKETSKTALYSGSLFAANQVLHPFYYKYAHEMKEKQTFSLGNLISSLFVWPLVLLIEWNSLVSIRKTLFICAYGQLRDFQTQNNRFYKLHPNHISTRAKMESERIKHPSEDPRKRLFTTKNSRAQLERKNEEKEETKRQVLAKNKGEKIPSAHLYIIMPQIYRPPTVAQKLEHEIKAAQKTQKILAQKGIKWITVTVPEKKNPEDSSQANGKEKKSWWPW